MPTPEQILWARFSALIDILSFETGQRYEFAEAIEPHEIAELLAEIDAARLSRPYEEFYAEAAREWREERAKSGERLVEQEWVPWETSHPKPPPEAGDMAFARWLELSHADEFRARKEREKGDK